MGTGRVPSNGVVDVASAHLLLDGGDSVRLGRARRSAGRLAALLTSGRPLDAGDLNGGRRPRRHSRDATVGRVCVCVRDRISDRQRRLVLTKPRDICAAEKEVLTHDLGPRRRNRAYHAIPDAAPVVAHQFSNNTRCHYLSSFSAYYAVSQC